MNDEANFLELLDIYLDLVEKQDAVIYHMSKVIAKQATEIQHYKNVYGFVDMSEPAGLQDAIRGAREALTDYEVAKGIE